MRGRGKDKIEKNRIGALEDNRMWVLVEHNLCAVWDTHKALWNPSSGLCSSEFQCLVDICVRNINKTPIKIWLKFSDFFNTLTSFMYYLSNCSFQHSEKIHSTIPLKYITSIICLTFNGVYNYLIIFLLL